MRSVYNMCVCLHTRAHVLFMFSLHTYVCLKVVLVCDDIFIYFASVLTIYNVSGVYVCLSVCVCICACVCVFRYRSLGSNSWLAL